MLDSDELKRRIDALRTLRGLTQTELAEIIRQDGFGKHDVGRLERGDIVLTRALRRSLADHLGVPEEWFVERDLDKVIAQSDVPAGFDQRLDRLQETLGALHTEIIEQSNRVADLKIEVLARIYERLETIDQRLARLDDLPSRVENLEKTVEPIVELAVMRAASDFAAAAEPQEPGEAPGASQDTGRRRPGPGAADQ